MDSGDKLPDQETEDADSSPEQQSHVEADVIVLQQAEDTSSDAPEIPSDSPSIRSLHSVPSADDSRSKAPTATAESDDLLKKALAERKLEVPSKPKAATGAIPKQSSVPKPPIPDKPVVHVYQSGQCSRLPSFQSDCLKVITWLRAEGVNFRLTNKPLDMERSYPVVMIGTVKIKNKTHMIDELSAELERQSVRMVELDRQLTEEEQLLAYSLGSLVEDYVGWEHREWCRTHHFKLLRAYKINLSKCWKKSLNFLSMSGFMMSASKKHPQRSKAMDSKTVLMELSNVLATKQYFFGDKIVSTLDVTVFAVLMPILVISKWVHFTLREKIKKCPNLVDFLLRMKQRHFHDWNVLCDVDGSFKIQLEE